MSDQPLQVTIDTSELQKYFGDWRMKLPIVYKSALRRMGEEVVRLIKNNWLTGQALNVRTGRLRSSIDYQFASEKEIRVGTNVVYAAIHEYGGVIVPRIAGALTLPLTVEAEKALHGARSFSDLFVWAPGGWGETAFLVRSGRGGMLTFMFMLRQKVTMPARPYVGPALTFYGESGGAARAVWWALKTNIQKWLTIKEG